MHIPDGYLSPSTCAVLYAGAAPFWYVALRRIKQELDTRTVPLLSLFAAFSFVVMMFNLPLPGGTTGHAVGMGIATIILGPWVSILAISMALLVQALFFGDGGITAFGANCFNMAIAGSLVAYAVYRIVSRGAEITSARRVLAAGLAGYAAINVGALCAAVEFGVQPLWFHDASGAPLYAPYPLSISVPAMMIGHLTFAGLAELILSAGIVSYFQRADPELLRRTAPSAPQTITTLRATDAGLPPRLTSRRLWLGLALLLILTPLGILAVGGAWGEWKAADFSDAAARQRIAAASRNQRLPERAPNGLERLSSIWEAPLSGYAPSFIRSPSFGYFVSAAVGVGVIILFSLLVNRLLIGKGDRAAGSLGGRFSSGTEPRASASGETEGPGQRTGSRWRRRRRRSFVEKTIQGLLNAMQEALFAENVSRSRGFLQSLDPRVKLAGISSLILATVAVHRIWALVALFCFSVLLAAFSHVSLRLLATRVWLAVLAFTGAIALPAVFLTPGHTLMRVPFLEWEASSQGVTSAILLTMRAETAATLLLLLVLSTMWGRLLRALRFFRTPAVVVIIAGMTYRYVFLLLQTAKNMLESRQTRLVGYLEPAEQRRFVAASAGLLLDKSLQLSSEVHTAMQARGFRGDVQFLDDLRMRGRDWAHLASFVGFACIMTCLGR